MKKKLMSLCLAVSILAGCLWGCANPSGTAGGSTSEQQTESKRQEEKQQEGPRGRYAESSIRSRTKKLPDTYGRVKNGRNRTTACWRDWSFLTGLCT